MQSRWKIKTIELGTWIEKWLKQISNIEHEHSSSHYAIISHVLCQPTAWILAHPDYLLNYEEETALNTNLHRLQSGEPLAYIIGKQYFFGLEFIVNPQVLIPRPETELLVEEAIKCVNAQPTIKMIADVGTGSGCIAVSLAKSLPGVKIWATDISRKALLTAKQNSQLNHVANQIYLCQSFLLDGIEKRFDLICANLPYIPTHTLSQLPDLKFEPHIALDGGNDGLDLIRLLLVSVKDKMQPSGMILLEIEQSHGAIMAEWCKSILPSAACTIINDLAGLPRLAIITQ